MSRLMGKACFTAQLDLEALEDGRLCCRSRKSEPRGQGGKGPCWLALSGPGAGQNMGSTASMDGALGSLGPRKEISTSSS